MVWGGVVRKTVRKNEQKGENKNEKQWDRKKKKKERNLGAPLVFKVWFSLFLMG